MLVGLGNKSIKRRLYLVVAIALTSVCPFAFAATVDIPPLLTLFETTADKTLKGGGVEFDIDKRAVILLKLPHIAQVAFDYEADGYFRLNYATVREGGYRVAHYFLMARPVMKGGGRIDLDLRHTINWSPESYPLLIVEGTGRLLIKNIKATTISDPLTYGKEKKRAFFWRPEVIRVTTINFLTPVFWDFENQLYWPAVLGGVFILTFMGFATVGFFIKQNFLRFLPVISIIFILVYSIHFVVRFLPIVHYGPFLSNNDKIRKNYFRPEFGQLVATAREVVKPSDRVLFMGETGDWLSPEALCFNVAPAKCVFRKLDGREYLDVVKVTRLKASEINVVVSYNSELDLPPGFEKIYEVNKNSFIAVKK